MAQPESANLVVTLLFLSTAVGVVVVLSKANTRAREQEMAGIEKLHRQDISATLSRDPKALADLWTDDGVLLEPGGQAKMGERVIGAEVEKAVSEHPGMKVLTYEPEIKEIKVTDGWAFEWGYFSSSYKDAPGEQVKSFRGKMLRIMRKQSDGTWKFARVVWNLAE